jgi:hypothetical protein
MRMEIIEDKVSKDIREQFCTCYVRSFCMDLVISQQPPKRDNLFDYFLTKVGLYCWGDL